jgi:uncharacterized protein (TIGR03437 family)
MKTFQIVSAMLLASGVASAQQYLISTVIGIPQVRGYFGDGGVATSAQLNKPTQLTFDSKGNVYFVDYYNQVVRMVTASTGEIITISGNGTQGWVDGSEMVSPTAPTSGTTTLNAGLSEINFPKGIAVDSSGNVYIGDTGNCRVRKVDTTYNTTTIAGNGTCGWAGDGGPATAAALNFPSGLAIDKSGNIYEAEYGSGTVRKIDTTGKITTIAGTGIPVFGGSVGDGGPATKAPLAAPTTVAIDAAGDIFIGDGGNSNIREITPDGNIHTFVSGVTANSMAIDPAGNLYFVDGVSPIVQEVTAGGSVITIAGNGTANFCCDGQQSTEAQVAAPGGVAYYNGNVYFTDTDNEVIRMLTPLPFSVGATTNAASGVDGPVAPGEIVAVFGNALGPATLTAGTFSRGFLSTQIPGAAQIFFNGVPAPLLYSSFGLASAIVPFEVAGAASVNVVLLYQGTTSATTVIPVTTAAPGIFTSNTTGTGQAAAVNVSTGSVNNAANPVRIGGYIELYITGAGQTMPALSDGQVATATAITQLPVTATVGGVNAPVTYAGAAPGEVAGVIQVNVQIPAGVSVGSAVPVTVSVGGIAGQSGVTIAVSN